MDQITPAQARALRCLWLAVAALAFAMIGVTGFHWGVHDARQWRGEQAGAVGSDRR